MSTAKGTRFETTLVPALDLYWPETVRLGKQGVNDKGDFHMPGNTLYVVEAKNCKKIELAKWDKEGEVEAFNKGVPYHVIVHKRRGFQQPEMQWATMRFGQWLALVHGVGNEQ